MLLRTLLVWTAGGAVTALLFVAVLFSLVLDRTGRLVHSIGALWCRIIVRLSGVKVRVEGVENLPADRPVIMLSNHQGAFDIPVLQGWLPLQFRWVAKKSLFSIPVVGWSMTLAGYISIERERSMKAYRSLLKAAEKIRAGTSVLVFPEGTRSATGRLLPFKKGAFLLASKSGVPVVPIAINGTAGIMKKGSLLIRPAAVTVRVGRPIETQGMDEKTLEKTVREAIESMLGTEAPEPEAAVAT